MGFRAGNGGFWRLQPRDRKGRWVEMFGIGKFSIDGHIFVGQAVDVDERGRVIMDVRTQDGKTLSEPRRMIVNPKELEMMNVKATLDANVPGFSAAELRRTKGTKTGALNPAQYPKGTQIKFKPKGSDTLKTAEKVGPNDWDLDGERLSNQDISAQHFNDSEDYSANLPKDADILPENITSAPDGSRLTHGNKTYTKDDNRWIDNSLGRPVSDKTMQKKTDGDLDYPTNFTEEEKKPSPPKKAADLPVGTSLHAEHKSGKSSADLDKTAENSWDIKTDKGQEVHDAPDSTVDRALDDSSSVTDNHEDESKATLDALPEEEQAVSAEYDKSKPAKAQSDGTTITDTESGTTYTKAGSMWEGDDDSQTMKTNAGIDKIAKADAAPTTPTRKITEVSDPDPETGRVAVKTQRVLPELKPLPEAQKPRELSDNEGILGPKPDRAKLVAAGEDYLNKAEPTQLDDEEYATTKQQQAIIDAVKDGKDVRAQALSGTGKTSTIVALAKRTPDQQMLYIAFNRSVQQEAEGRMPKNVEARTGHSLGYTSAPKFMKDRIKNGIIKNADLAANLDFDQPAGLSRTDVAEMAKKAVDNYTISAEDKILPEHIADSRANTPEQMDAVLNAANKLWEDYNSPDGQAKVTFNAMRKRWALSKPDLSKAGNGNKKAANIVVIDEAQDTPPVLAKVIADQENAQKVVVGDRNQAIYGSFTGSMDYLSEANADVELPLSNSYRFGDKVQDMGNRLLQMLDVDARVTGSGPKTEEYKDKIDSPDVILSRTNAGVISSVLEYAQEGRTIGAPKGTKKDFEELGKTIAYLKDGGPKPFNIHPDLAEFGSWDEIANSNSATAKKAVRLAENYGAPRILAAAHSIVEYDENSANVEPATKYKDLTFSPLPDGTVAAGGRSFNHKEDLKAVGFSFDKDKKVWVGTPEMRDALYNGEAIPKKPDMFVSTAHKAKGLEWDRVQLNDDFPEPREDEETGELKMPSTEELNLQYVAATRAKKALGYGPLGYVFDHSDENGGTPKKVTPENNKDYVDTPSPEEASKREADEFSEVTPEKNTESPSKPTEDTAPESAPEEDTTPEPVREEESVPAETAPEPTEEAPTTPAQEEPVEDAPTPVEEDPVREESLPVEEAPTASEVQTEAPTVQEEPTPERTSRKSAKQVSSGKDIDWEEDSNHGIDGVQYFEDSTISSDSGDDYRAQVTRESGKYHTEVHGPNGDLVHESTSSTKNAARNKAAKAIKENEGKPSLSEDADLDKKMNDDAKKVGIAKPEQISEDTEMPEREEPVNLEDPDVLPDYDPTEKNQNDLDQEAVTASNEARTPGDTIVNEESGLVLTRDENGDLHSENGTRYDDSVVEAQNEEKRVVSVASPDDVAKGEGGLDQNYVKGNNKGITTRTGEADSPEMIAIVSSDGRKLMFANGGGRGWLPVIGRNEDGSFKTSDRAITKRNLDKILDNAVDVKVKEKSGRARPEPKRTEVPTDVDKTSMPIPEDKKQGYTTDPKIKPVPDETTSLEPKVEPTDDRQRTGMEPNSAVYSASAEGKKPRLLGVTDRDGNAHYVGDRIVTQDRSKNVRSGIIRTITPVKDKDGNVVDHRIDFVPDDHDQFTPDDGPTLDEWRSMSPKEREELPDGYGVKTYRNTQSVRQSTMGSRGFRAATDSDTKESLRVEQQEKIESTKQTGRVVTEPDIDPDYDRNYVIRDKNTKIMGTRDSEGRLYTEGDSVVLPDGGLGTITHIGEANIKVSVTRDGGNKLDDTEMFTADDLIHSDTPASYYDRNFGTPAKDRVAKDFNGNDLRVGDTLDRNGAKFEVTYIYPDGKKIRVKGNDYTGDQGAAGRSSVVDFADPQSHDFIPAHVQRANVGDELVQMYGHNDHLPAYRDRDLETGVPLDTEANRAVARMRAVGYSQETKRSGIEFGRMLNQYGREDKHELYQDRALEPGRSVSMGVKRNAGENLTDYIENTFGDDMVIPDNSKFMGYDQFGKPVVYIKKDNKWTIQNGDGKQMTPREFFNHRMETAYRSNDTDETTTKDNMDIVYLGDADDVLVPSRGTMLPKNDEMFATMPVGSVTKFRDGRGNIVSIKKGADGEWYYVKSNNTASGHVEDIKSIPGAAQFAGVEGDTVKIPKKTRQMVYRRGKAMRDPKKRAPKTTFTAPIGQTAREKIAEADELRAQNEKMASELEAMKELLRKQGIDPDGLGPVTASSLVAYKAGTDRILAVYNRVDGDLWEYTSPSGHVRQFTMTDTPSTPGVTYVAKEIA